MEIDIFLKNAEYLLNLIAAAINEEQPREPGGDIDFESVYSIAQKHDVVNTSFYSVEKLSRKPEPKLYKKWMNNRNKCVHKNMIQNEEFALICGAFENEKLEYMPVKGFDIARLYPAEDYRVMSDLDILIKDNREKAEELLLGMGYTENKNNADHDKAYSKPPFMVVELHNNLLPLTSPFRSYFDDIFSRSEKNGCRYKMTKEDFYIFQIVHLYKHYTLSGTGIRSVADLYLTNKKLLPKLNCEYINSELENLGLTEFTQRISEIAEKWFSAETSADNLWFDEDEMYILTSGTFGSIKNKITNRLSGRSKGSFLISRLFPSKKEMYENHPKAKKHSYLLPWFYVFRFFRYVFTNNSKFRYEMKVLKESNKYKNESSD
jgi:hypothetical protein